MDGLRIILKRILKKHAVYVLCDINWLIIFFNNGPYGSGNEPSGFMAGSVS